jgi:hypothetical protein
MTIGSPMSSQVYQLARYEVRSESVDRCLAAIHQSVAYVRQHEDGAL